jgi:hypothetical protein
MSDFHRQRIDPVALLKRWGWPHEHITYDPKLLDSEYEIVRGSRHDGTFLFTDELVKRTLLELAQGTSYFRGREEESLKAGEIHYIVGPLKLATVYGKVKLPCSEDRLYPGQRERTRIAVKTVLIPGPPFRSAPRAIPPPEPMFKKDTICSLNAAPIGKPDLTWSGAVTGPSKSATAGSIDPYGLLKNRQPKPGDALYFERTGGETGEVSGVFYGTTLTWKDGEIGVKRVVVPRAAD